MFAAVLVAWGAVPRAEASGDWTLAVNGGVRAVLAGSISDAMLDLADREFSRFRTSYGAAPGSHLSWCGRDIAAPAGAVHLDRRVGDGWGWRVVLGANWFRSCSSIDMTGTGGETLKQYWDLLVVAVPVLGGFWMESETKRGFLLRANASAGWTILRGNLHADRKFTGTGGNSHCWTNNPLAASAPTAEVGGSIGYRILSWWEVYLEAGYLAVAPTALVFQGDADVNLDGRNDFWNGQEFTDQTGTPAPVDFSGPHLLLGFSFSL